MSASVYAQIVSLLDHLAPEEQLRLIEELARRLREGATPAAPPVPDGLYELTAGAEAFDIDVERAMREMRAEWLKDLEPGEDTP